MAEFAITIIINCPRCKGEHVVKNGRKRAEQRYRCRDCSRTFTNTDTGFQQRYPSEQVGAAIRMFYSGTSYKQIAENMEDMYDIPEPSKSVIYEWVKDNTDVAINVMEQHPADTSGNWVADEMMVDVGGEKLWNWNVMDSGTRYILASYLSRNRNAYAAKAVMRKALSAAAKPPKTITTDKLRSYLSAIKETMPDTQHILSQGLRADVNNNRSERVQGTFRQRTKTLRGLDSLETGQRYLDGWVTHYNLFREHESLGYRTPGEVARVNSPFKEWADVVRIATASPPIKLPSNRRAKHPAVIMPQVRPTSGRKPRIGNNPVQLGIIAGAPKGLRHRPPK